MPAMAVIGIDLAIVTDGGWGMVSLQTERLPEASDDGNGGVPDGAVGG